MTGEEILKGCTVEGCVVKLPPVMVDRKIYLQVAGALEKIGGKWNKKAQGFVFAADPTELLEEIQAGGKRNLKKEFQFFATPAVVADTLVSFFSSKEWSPAVKVLEPSAGDGALVKAMRRKYPEVMIDCYELYGPNRTALAEVEGARLLGPDFLTAHATGKYDWIIANPPFSGNQDIVHIQKMYQCLAPGGRLATIASAHWGFSSNRKETEFTQWLFGLGAFIQDIEAGAFKESGTSVSSKIVVIDKEGQ